MRRIQWISWWEDPHGLWELSCSQVVQVENIVCTVKRKGKGGACRGRSQV